MSMSSRLKMEVLVQLMVLMLAFYEISGHESDDNNHGSKVQFKTSKSTVHESDGQINITLKRVQKLNTKPNIKIKLGGDATRDTDYSIIKGSLSFQFNKKSNVHIIPLNILADDDREDKETITLTIEDGGEKYNVGKRGTHTVTIKDDNAAIKCITEAVQESSKQTVITLKKTGYYGVSFDVNCSTTDDTAKNKTDYTLNTKALTFAKGYKETLNFNIGLKDDNIAEPTESFYVTCQTSNKKVNVRSSCTNVKVEINDDDVNVFFCPNRQLTIKENAMKYTVHVCRAGILSAGHQIRLCWTSDGNTYPSVNAGCVDVTFTSGEVHKEHNISIEDDQWGEEEFKTFTVSMNTSDTAVTFNHTTSYNVTLQDNDNTFSLKGIANSSVMENAGEVKVNVSRVGQISSGADVMIQLKFLSASYENCRGNDTEVTFEKGVAEKEITVCSLQDDQKVESDKTFKVEIAGVAGSNVEEDAKENTFTIINDDAYIYFCPSTDTSVQESNGTYSVKLCRAGGTHLSHQVQLCWTSDGNTFPSVNAGCANVTFASGEVRKEHDISISNNHGGEVEIKKFAISMNSSDSSVTLNSTTSCSITLQNRGTIVQCANSTISVPGNRVNVSLVLERKGFLDREFPIWYGIVNGTANQTDNSLQVNKTSVTFKPGQKHMHLRIELFNDDVINGDGTFFIVIGSLDPTAMTSSTCTKFVVSQKEVKEGVRINYQHESSNLLTLFVVLTALVTFLLVLAVMLLLYVLWLRRRRKPNIYSWRVTPRNKLAEE